MPMMSQLPTRNHGIQSSFLDRIFPLEALLFTESSHEALVFTAMSWGLVEEPSHAVLIFELS